MKRLLLLVLLPIVTFAVSAFVFTKFPLMAPPAEELASADSSMGDHGRTGNEDTDSSDANQQPNKDTNAADSVLAEIEQERKELKELRDELKGYIDKVESKKTEDLEALAKLYDGIDQEQLAYIFNHMEDSLVIRIIPKMKSKNAAKILEYLEPERAARISRLILGETG
ncbi:MAG: hypothetical protein GF315_03845 [candidate division Zixibacteria bacterium]|nr:hypothetical protein [candidate division Zixibacteria bacterium]